MRILIQGRDVEGEREGGDSALVARVAGELASLGHEVVVRSSPPDRGVDAFDVVHAVNIDRSQLASTEAFSAAACSSGVRLVVTPLWWPLEGYINGLARTESLLFRLRGTRALRAVRDRSRASLRRLERRQADVLSPAAAVCVSGAGEARALQEVFGRLPCMVTYYGTDMTQLPADGERGGVLCVARLDPRKNQLALIKALRGTGLSLRLVGTAEVFPSYARACRTAAGPEVEFAGYVPAAELRDAYRRARVHVLPSYFELPGLTSLDAAAAGAAVVVSSAGTARDYFGAAAWYCGTDEASIRNAVVAAYESGPGDGLARRITARYRWRDTALQWLDAYATCEGASP